MNMENFLRTLKVMYTTSDNSMRSAATLELLRAEDRMSSEDLLHIGVGLLRIADHGAAVQAYGAVLLRRAVSSGRLTATSVPCTDILLWYFNEPSLGRLLCGDLVDLITECMVFQWPEEYPDLMAQVCPPQAQLARHPRKIRLLCSLVVKFMEPHFGNVPVNRMKRLKSSMSSYSHVILVEVIQALFDMYTLAGGEGSHKCVEGTRDIISDCMTIMMTIAASLNVLQWWESGMGNALSVMVHWKPVAQEALGVTAALLRCEEVSKTAPNPALLALVTAVLDSVGQQVGERNYEIVEEIAELLLDLPESIIQAVVAPVGRVCLVMLTIPSIYIASCVCSVLLRFENAVFHFINPLDLIMRISALVQKNRFHPEIGTNEEGKFLSVQQYGSSALFSRGFAEFRSVAGRVLNSVVTIYPVASNQFVLQLLTGLCDGRGTSEDPRTPVGFVTQWSPTFLEWEATQFLLCHLSESFKYSSDHLLDAIEVLVRKQTEDMVLCPVFLNMLSSFWSCRDDVAMGILEGTLDIIFSCLERRNIDKGDIDTVSARKRALTLLVNVCSQHTARLQHLCDAFMKRIGRLLMMSCMSPHEKTLLYEASAALTCALPPEEAQRRLQSLLAPVIRILIQRMGNVSQNEFNDIIVARTSKLHGDRDLITGSISVIAGVFRRCKTFPFLIEASTEMAPSVMQLMELIHGIRADQLPPRYAGILDLGNEERVQYLPGQSRRTASNVSDKAVRGARGALMDLRVSLYQVIGSLSAFLPAEAFRGMLQTMVLPAEVLPAHTMRALIVQCLFPIAGTYDALIPDVLQVCRVFFARCSKRVAAERPEDDVVDLKLLFHFSKDVLTFIRHHIVEKGMLERNTDLVVIVVEVLVGILQCGTNASEASRMIMTIINGSSPKNGNAMAVWNEELAVNVFGRVLDFSVNADDAVLSFKDRERLIFLLSDAYVEQFPRYEGALQARFLPESMDELHTHLTMSKRFDLKRQRFKEFLLSAVRDTAGRR